VTPCFLTFPYQPGCQQVVVVIMLTGGDVP